VEEVGQVLHQFAPDVASHKGYTVIYAGIDFYPCLWVALLDRSGIRNQHRCIGIAV
jgi:hypothetical protein